MYRRVACLLLMLACVAPRLLQGQDFPLWQHTVQIHGWLSQGFVYTNHNNWLTMNTSSGSGAMTDMGLNMSSQLTDKLRIGGQVYDRNLGQLGKWHPSLDWAMVDYRFSGWLGFRAGKVKTVMGLYTDTQDQEFLHTFALLPQSVYPTDLRDATIAHSGGDVYGRIPLKCNYGDIAYTFFAGHRSDSIHSGYPYLISQYWTFFSSLGGLQYGADVRWQTAKGLLIGFSRMNEDTTGKGKAADPLNPQNGFFPYSEYSRSNWTNQFYAQYVVKRLRVDSEFRRYFRDQMIFGGTSEDVADVRGWYVAGTYRLMRRVQVGSYYSHYTVTSEVKGALGPFFPSFTDTSQPSNHIYDKVITARVDVNRLFNFKLEGHFMDGYGASLYPNGFYPQVNRIFAPNTNALVARTSFSF